jgi:hypothetical protein
VTLQAQEKKPTDRSPRRLPQAKAIATMIQKIAHYDIYIIVSRSARKDRMMQDIGWGMTPPDTML